MLKEFEFKIKALRVIPSDGGKFEITMNGELIFSKLQLGRHAEPGEVLSLARDYMESLG